MTPCDFCALSPQSRGVGLASAYVQILTCPSVSRHAVKIHPCRGSCVGEKHDSRRVLGGRCALLERSHRRHASLYYTVFGIIYNFFIARVCVKSRKGKGSRLRYGLRRSERRAHVDLSCDLSMFFTASSCCSCRVLPSFLSRLPAHRVLALASRVYLSLYTTVYLLCVQYVSCE